ncbi:MAG: hypothetical protein ACQEXJ_07425 [Myxococcota bacterium]
MADGRRPDAIADRLRASLGGDAREVRVVVTSNRVRLVSVQPRPAALEVRVAERLLALGPQVVDPIVGFVQGAPGARKALKALIAEVPAEASGPRRRRRIVLRPVGAHHDLRPLLEAEARRAFGEVPEVHLTWARRQRIGRRQRSIRLGSYCPQRRLIRIHRILDHPSVPAWFIGFILHHELLHHHLGIEEVAGRRVIHPPELQRLEAAHPRFEEAQRWEAERLPLLMAGKLR